MIPRHDDFVPVRQLLQPTGEIVDFVHQAAFAEVTGVDQQIALRDLVNERELDWTPRGGTG